MFAKQKILTLESQLKQAGVRIEWLNKRLEKLTFNMQQNVTARTQELINVHRDYNLQKCAYRYRWKNLPKNITSWQIESMLYLKGSLVGFVTAGTLFFLPWANAGDINTLGMPTKVQPISYNGEIGTAGAKPAAFGLPLQVTRGGTLRSKDKCGVLLYDRIPWGNGGAGCIPRSVLNTQLIELQADIVSRISDNLEAASLKLVFECDDEPQAAQLDKDIAANLAAGKSWVIVKRDSLSGMDGKTYQTGVTLETQTLVECWQSVTSMLDGMDGIRNGGAFEKKERVITGELESDSIQADVIVDVGLEMRTLFLEDLKAQFPDNADILAPIEVELVEPLKQAQESLDPVRERVEPDGAKEVYA